MKKLIKKILRYFGFGRRKLIKEYTIEVSDQLKIQHGMNCVDELSPVLTKEILESKNK